MKLFMWREAVPNFGDELNTWIWPKIIPAILDDDDSSLFVGIGTLLNRRLPPQPKVVFGSGAGYGSKPDLQRGTCSFYCVRGPMTARVLQLPESLAVTDPAILVRRLFDTKRDGVSPSVGFMPHWVTTLDGRWREACDAAEVRYIDPRDAVPNVLQAIACCRLLVTEAMHGAIVADALRVPWIPVRIRPSPVDFKWRDWCKSVALEYRPLQLPGSTTEEELLIRYGWARSRILRSYRKIADSGPEDATRADALPKPVKSSVARTFDNVIQTRALPALASGIAHVTRADRQLERAVTALRNAVRRDGALSADATVSALTDELEMRLDRLRRDVAEGRIHASAGVTAYPGFTQTAHAAPTEETVAWDKANAG
jgi:succinoglycan biosynthesis protein ExoV